MTDNEYLTINQVCDILHLHRNTVENWLRSEKLKGYKMGGKLWRALRTDVDEMVLRTNKEENENGKP